AGEVADLKLIVRGDVLGSVEAVVSELSKFEHSEVRLNVIAQGVGAITQNDIMLASASDALIVGFNVRPNAEARELAQREGVEIRVYNVIYKLTEEIEQALVGKLSAVTTEETIGEAEVRMLFRVSRLGTIAGCTVTNGAVRRSAGGGGSRDGTVSYTTTIARPKRVEDDPRAGAERLSRGSLATSLAPANAHVPSGVTCAEEAVARTVGSAPASSRLRAAPTLPENAAR